MVMEIPAKGWNQTEVEAEQALSPEGERLSDHTVEQWGDILADFT